MPEGNSTCRLPAAVACTAAFAAALFLAACGGGSPDEAQVPGGISASTTAPATTATKAEDKPAKTSTTGDGSTDNAEASGPVLRLDSFNSPSRNIACYIGSAGDGGARCDIREKSWTVSRPSGCEFDFGQGLTVGPNSSRGEVVCAGDTVLGSASATLPYGSSARRGSISCTSREAGVTCTNAAGHGFFISHGSYRLF